MIKSFSNERLKFCIGEVTLPWNSSQRSGVCAIFSSITHQIFRIELRYPGKFLIIQTRHEPNGNYHHHQNPYAYFFMLYIHINIFMIMLYRTEKSDHFLCFRFFGTNKQGLFFVMFVNSYNFCFTEMLVQILENDKERRN